MTANVWQMLFDDPVVHVIQNSGVGIVRRSPLNQHIYLLSEPIGTIQLIWKLSIGYFIPQCPYTTIVLALSILWDVLVNTSCFRCWLCSCLQVVIILTDFLSIFLLLVMVFRIIRIIPGPVNFIFFSCFVFIEIKNYQFTACYIVLVYKGSIHKYFINF